MHGRSRDKFNCLVLAATFLFGCAQAEFRTSGSERAEPAAEAEPERVVSAPAGASQSEKPDAQNGAVLMAVSLSGNEQLIPARGCRLKFENAQTQETTFASLLRGARTLALKLEPGRYRATRLSCGTTKIWNLEQLLGEGFVVRAGAYSYVGQIEFEFGASELTRYQHATRKTSAQALSEWREGSEAVVISGFSGKVISGEILSADGPEGFDLVEKGSAQAEKTLAPLLSQLKLCSADLLQTDPLRIGHLRYVAVYQARRFKQLKSKLDRHALGDVFTRCVDSAMVNFAPSFAGEMEVTVAY